MDLATQSTLVSNNYYDYSFMNLYFNYFIQFNSLSLFKLAFLSCINAYFIDHIGFSHNCFLFKYIIFKYRFLIITFILFDNVSLSKLEIWNKWFCFFLIIINTNIN